MRERENESERILFYEKYHGCKQRASKAIKGWIFYSKINFKLWISMWTCVSEWVHGVFAECYTIDVSWANGDDMV